MNRNLIVQLTNGDQDNIFPSAYYDHKGKVIHDGLVSSTDRSKWDGYEAQIEAHTSNSGIHVTTNNKTKWNNHVNDATATLPVYHLTSDEKDLLKNLYQKVYPVGCVYSSINNVSPTFEGTSWDPIDPITVPTPTIYRWVRVEG